MNMMAIPSFHRFLQEYLEVVRKLLKLLQTPDLSYTYQWFYLEESNPARYNHFYGGQYTTYKDCVKAAMDAVCNQQWMPENIPLTVEIIKCESDNALIRAFLNRKGTLLSMDCSGTILLNRNKRCCGPSRGCGLIFPRRFRGATF